MSWQDVGGVYVPLLCAYVSIHPTHSLNTKKGVYGNALETCDSTSSPLFTDVLARVTLV